MWHKKIRLLGVILISTGLWQLVSGQPIQARGSDVFTRPVLFTYGGVVLQGVATFMDEEGKAISPKNLTLGHTVSPSGAHQVCVLYEEECFAITIPYSVSVPLAEWVLTGDTGAYSAFELSTEELQNYLVSVSDVVPRDYAFAPPTLAQRPIPQILDFLDFGLVLKPFDDTAIREKYNARLRPGLDLYDPALSSYVNTDTDTRYVAQLIDGKVKLSGLISRYHWMAYESTVYPFISTIERACTLREINAKSEECRSQDEYGYYTALSDYPPGEMSKIYRQQRDGLLLARTAAVFRRFADDNPQVLRKFVEAQPQ